MVRTVTCLSMLAVMDLIKKLYPIRTSQTQSKSRKHSRRQVQRMSGISHKELQGPCIGQQSHEEYMKNIGEIKNILKGDTQIVSDLLMEEMQACRNEI